jgi:hypothetical protein
MIDGGRVAFAPGTKSVGASSRSIFLAIRRHIH